MSKDLFKDQFVFLKAELRRFFQFVLDCEREAQSDYVTDEDSKPDWWHKDLPFTEELWESQTKRGVRIKS